MRRFPVSFDTAGHVAFATLGQLSLDETVFGMNIQVVNTPFGELSLTQHPMFREASGLQSWIVVVDLPLLAQKTYEKLFLEPNIQANGSDSYLEQYRAKLGLKLKFPQAFAIGTSLTALSA